MAGTKKATKDLQPKTASVKGGKLAVNDNVTLLRGARPTKKDLPAGKDIKGGKIAGNDSLTLVRG